MRDAEQYPKNPEGAAKYALDDTSANNALKPYVASSSRTSSSGISAHASEIGASSPISRSEYNLYIGTAMNQEVGETEKRPVQSNTGNMLPANANFNPAEQVQRKP